MNKVLEILLIIGIFANLLKGADLLLRRKQQDWIQEKFEILTLRLDYTRPLDWYTGFKSRKARLSFIIASSLLYFSLDISISLINWNQVTVYWLLLRVLVISWITWQFIDRTKREHPLIKFILSGERFNLFLSRPCLILAMGIAINIALATLLIAFFLSYISGELVGCIILLYSELFILGLFLTFMPIIEIEMLAVLSLLVLLTSVILLISEALLRIIRGIAWRIVEYTKGAYAAIVLLITVVLSILELYLKAK